MRNPATAPRPPAGTRIEYGVAYGGGHVYTGTVVDGGCDCPAVHAQCDTDARLHHVSTYLFRADNRRVGHRWARVLSEEGAIAGGARLKPSAEPIPGDRDT